MRRSSPSDIRYAALKEMKLRRRLMEMTRQPGRYLMLITLFISSYRARLSSGHRGIDITSKSPASEVEESKRMK